MHGQKNIKHIKLSTNDCFLLTAYCFHTLHTNKFIHSKNVPWNTLFWVKRTLLIAFNGISIANPVHCFIKSRI